MMRKQQSLRGYLVMAQVNNKELKRRVLIHWAHNLRKAKAGTLCPADLSGSECAFCRYFVLCVNCPIKQRTGKILCRATPYILLGRILDAEVNGNLVQAVEAEIAFLKSLDCG